MKCFFILITVFLFDVFYAVGNIRLPNIISDNMVLQRGMKIPVWGWADPGEKIIIEFSGYQVETVADDNGKWKLFIGPLDANGSFEFTLTGKNKIKIKNILVGEVWVCSGQSNMEMPVGNVAKWYSGVRDYEEEIAAANYPDIRLFKEGRIVADQPRDDCEGSWTLCTSGSITDFSAVAYFFGRKLYHELGIPIGIIDASNGGTNISAWLSKEELNSDAEYQSIFDNFQQILDRYPEALKTYQQKEAEFQKKVDAARAAGKPVPWRGPMPPAGPGDRNTPSGLYNGMIVPLMNYSVAGIIWYQGENNTGNPQLYEKLFPALIKSWRKGWGQGDFPFYYVQLAGFDTNQTWWGGSGKDWVLLREAQQKALLLPNTGMAVAVDIGDADDTHFKNKQEAGRRLALLALAKTYGKNIVYSGPVFKSMAVKGDKIVVYFNHKGSGLSLLDGAELRGFLISGENKKFVSAKGIIKDDAVIVSSSLVAKPVAVRYAWKDLPVCNLGNKENLPAWPFRTDNWVE